MVPFPMAAGLDDCYGGLGDAVWPLQATSKSNDGSSCEYTVPSEDLVYKRPGLTKDNLDKFRTLRFFDEAEQGWDVATFR